MKQIIIFAGLFLSAIPGFAQSPADSSEQYPSIQAGKDLFENYKTAGKKKDSVADAVAASFDTIAAEITRMCLEHQEALSDREQEYEMEKLSLEQSAIQLQNSAKKTTMWVAASGLAAVLFFLIVILILLRRAVKSRRIVEDKNDAIEQQKKVLEHFTEQLHASHGRIQALEALLPLCPSCKKPRDDNAYMNRVEKYLLKPSDPSFKQAVCSDCAKKLYPGVFGKME